MTRDLVKPVALVALAALVLPGFASPTLAQNRGAGDRIAALSSPDPVARAMAACELGRMPAADVRPARDALLALLGDDIPIEPKLCRDWENRRGGGGASSPGREAAMALEDFGTDILPELTELLQDSRPAAREQAAFALGLIESELAIEPLARVLGDDPEPEVREQAAWAMGMIESVRGVEGLTAAAADSDPRVRTQVAWALGMIESAAGVAPLQRLLRDDAAEVRQQAAWALGMIESADAVESLIQALADSEARVREQAAWALGMIESAGATGAIADALERETDDGVRRQLVWALARVIDMADLDMEPSALAALLRRALLGHER